MFPQREIIQSVFDARRTLQSSVFTAKAEKTQRNNLIFFAPLREINSFQGWRTKLVKKKIALKKNKKNKKSLIASTGPTSIVKKRNFTLILISVITISVAFFATWYRATDRSVQIDKISLEDRKILGSIILMVASNPDDMETVDKSFRDILKKYSAESEINLVHLKKYMRGLFYLPKLFYEDAQKAIQDKGPFKSTERNRLEQHFLKSGFLTMEQIQNDDDIMELIAHKKPIKGAHDVEIFIDEKRIAEMLREWNDKEVENMINELFRP